MSDPQLKKGIFGYTAESVRVLLEDRDRMFRQAAEDAKAAEARTEELRAAVEASERELNEGVEELRTALEEIGSLRSELEVARAELASTRESARLSESAAAERDEARAEADRHAARARAAEERSTELRVELDRLNDEREIAGGDGSEVRELRSELAALQDRLEALRREHDGALRQGVTAEARIKDMQTQLTSARAELDESRRNAAGLRARLEREPAASSPEPTAGTPTAKDVSLLLQSTEETMSRIIREAKVRTDAELVEAERAWGRVQEDTRRLRAWRERVAPLVGEFRDSVEDAKARAAEIPAQLLEAIAPMTEVIETLGRRLDEMAQVAKPSPGSLESVPGEGGRHVIELREVENEADAPRGTS